MTSEDTYNKAISGDVTLTEIELHAIASGIDVSESFNQVSLLIAQRFMNGDLSYKVADYAMNGVWSVMLNYIRQCAQPLVEPCYSVYCAFDEGEYDHRDGADPVEKYTRPALQSILGKA